MRPGLSLLALFVMSMAFAVSLAWAVSGAGGGKEREADKDASTRAVHAVPDDNQRLEGERKFHSNCGRCHAAPPKFSQHMAATIVRHMRVRATITDEEARLILQYLAQ